MLSLNEEIMVVNTITKLPIKIVMKVDTYAYINTLLEIAKEAKKNKEIFVTLGQENPTTDINENHKNAIFGINAIKYGLLDENGILSEKYLMKHIETLPLNNEGMLEKDTYSILWKVANMANYLEGNPKNKVAPTIELKVITTNEIHIVESLRLFEC